MASEPRRACLAPLTRMPRPIESRAVALGQIDDDVTRPLGDALQQERFELGTRVDIDVAAHIEDGHVCSWKQDLGAKLWIGLHLGDLPCHRWRRA